MNMTPGALIRLTVALVLMTGSLLLAAESEPAVNLPDPLPISRVLLGGDRLPRELDRLKQGVLVQLPRSEFEERVRRAVAKSRRPNAPMLVEAHYRAALNGQALQGSGQWKVLQRGQGPGLLPLQPGGQPFTLALAQARFDKHDALIAEFDGKSLALLMEEPGEHTVALEWSARGEARPEGLHFDLKVPPAPVAVLELDLPAGLSPGGAEGCLLSGPYPAAAADRRLWRIGCGGRSQVHLLVRPGTDAPPLPPDFARQRNRLAGLFAAAPRGPLHALAGLMAWPVEEPPPLLAVRSLKTTQRLSPEGLDATFEFDLEALHPGIRELVAECDASLRPQEINAANLDSWEVRPGANPALVQLILRFREPLQDGSLLIHCLAPLGSAVPAPNRTPGPGSGPVRAAQVVSWTSPGLRLVRAVPRGETLELLVHPDLHLENVRPGSFRLTATTTVADSERQVALQKLTLVGGGVRPETPGTPLARPALRLHTHGVDFRARQLAWWQLNPGGMALTLQISYQVRHGRLFQLPLLLPPDWEVETVEMSPASLLRNWAVRRSTPRPLLVVDLQHPLSSAGDSTEPPESPGRSRIPTVNVQLRPLRPGPLTGRELAFPDAAPLGARFREGALALDFDEQLYQPAVRTSLARAEAEEEGPWGKQGPDYYYPYRGDTPEGTLVLQPRPPRLRAKVASEVFVTAGRAAIETRLLLEAEAGSPDTIDLYLSSAAGPWEWAPASPGRPGPGRPSGPAANRVVRTQPLAGVQVAGTLAALAARTPLSAAALAVARPRGELWRLTLARPLRVRDPLLLTAARPLEPVGGSWEVPLAALPGANRLDGEVTLHLAGADHVQVDTVGLREVPATSPWRTFRYGHGPIALGLRGGWTATPPARAVAGPASLTSYLHPGGEPRHHFVFRMNSWPQRTLPLRLPPDTRLLAVQVDGHWLPRLFTSEQDPNELQLPVPERDGANDTTHTFEVIYTGGGGPGALGGRVEAPSPDLPVPPASFRRTWYLPPHLAPLFDNRYRRLPGVGEQLGLRDVPHRPLDLFRAVPLPAWATQEAWFLPAWTGARLDARAEPRQALIAAGMSLRKARAGQTLPLRELVDLLAFQYLPGQALVLDSVALAEAGIGPETPLPVKALVFPGDPPLPGEDMGLALLPAASALLLTTRRQAELWQAVSPTARSPAGPRSQTPVWERGPAGERPLPEEVERALAAAVHRGQDPSGRFRSALDSLRPGAAGGGATDAGVSRLPPLSPEGNRLSWTEWEPVAGATSEDLMIVVRRDLPTGAGVLLAAFLVLLFWSMRPAPSRWRLVLLLAWLALAGGSLYWLPRSLQDLAWWPFLTGCVFALFGYLRWATRGPAAPPPSRPSTPERGSTPAVVSAAVGVAVCLAAWGEAADTGPPAPVTVYLVPGPPDAPEKQSVLAPPELLERLKTLGATPPTGDRAVLLAVSYQGKILDGAADFEAVFQAHCLGDGPATLTIPLGGVQLVGDVWLDGARAHPVALPPSPPVGGAGAGYSLPILGRGRHKIELRFRVRVTGPAEARDLQFSAPRLAQNRLTLQTPPGSTGLQALVKHGAQRVTATGAGLRLDVDLGAVAAPLHFRWHEEALRIGPPRVQFREAYFWDLGVDWSALTALVRYTIPGRAVATLTIDLPPELEVRGAEAHRPTNDSSGPVRLRAWRVIRNGDRTRALELEFQHPTTGEVEVMLDFAPREPLPAGALLPLPAPHGSRLPNGGYLAYRLRGLEAQRNPPRGVTAIGVAEFAPFWPASTRPDPRSLAYACTIRREGSQPPELVLRLSVPPPAAHATQNIVLRVGPYQAEVQVTAELRSPGNDLALIEWELQSPQPLTIASVKGRGVRDWNQSGNRILVGLERTAGTVRLELSGWLSHPPSSFDLPCLRLWPARTQVTTLRVEAGSGLALSAGELRGLLPLPEPRPSEQELSFVTRDPFWSGSCQVRAGASAAARILTFVEVRERQLTFTANLDYEVQRGDLRTLTVRLRNWEGEELQLEAPVAAERREHRSRPGDRTWTLRLQPGVTGRYRLTLRGSLPLEEASVGVPMPDVSVTGVERSERWLALASPDLAAEGARGLLALSNPGTTLSSWPREADRVRRTNGPAWKVIDPDWKLRLVPNEPAAEPVPVRVFLTEHHLSVIDGRRWQHDVIYRLRHAAQADLNVTLPAAAEVTAVAVDGGEVTPLQPEPRRLWLPLPGRAGVRRVRVCFCYLPEAGERLERPNLESPRLEGASPSGQAQPAQQEGPVLWTVYVPAGWLVAAANGAHRLGLGPARVAALAVSAAEAESEVSRALAAQRRESGAAAQLAGAQRRFYRDCLLAGRALEGGPQDAEGLVDRLQKVQARHKDLAADLGFEDLRAEAERQSRGGVAAPLPSPVDEEAGRFAGLGRSTRMACPVAQSERGTPFSWEAGGEEAAPDLRLSPVEEQQTWAALESSGTWLGVIALVWLVSLAPFLLARLRACWPEQLLILAVIGFWLTGPQPIVLGLLVLGVLGRLIAIVRGLGHLWRRRPVVAPSSRPGG
jgi:hypothetical protein